MKHLILLVTLALTVGLTTQAHAKKDSEANVEFLNTKPSTKLLPFSEAVRVGDTIYLSGQIGIDSKTRKLAPGGLKGETAQTLKNIKHSLNKYGYEMKDVVKCMVMLTDINDFKAFNEVYTSYFTPPYPARSAFAVKDLAINSVVEIECMATK